MEDFNELEDAVAKRTPVEVACQILAGSEGRFTWRRKIFKNSDVAEKWLKKRNDIIEVQFEKV